MTPCTPYASTERDLIAAIRFLLRALPEAEVELREHPTELRARWTPRPLEQATLMWRDGFWLAEFKAGAFVGRSFVGLRGADALTLVRWIAADSGSRERLAKLCLIRYDSIHRAGALRREGGWQPVAARLLTSKNEGDQMSGLCLVGAAQAVPAVRGAAPPSPL